MVFDNNTVISVLTATVFTVYAVRHQQWIWLGATLLMWLTLGTYSANVLPGILGTTQQTNIAISHIYIALGSVFFAYRSVFRQPKAQYYQSQAGTFLTLLALAIWAMHAMFALLSILIWWNFPSGITPAIAPILLQLYFFDSPVWWTMTLWLMLLFALHRVWLCQPLTQFSFRQLESGCLIALLMQTSYIVHDLWHSYGNG